MKIQDYIHYYLGCRCMAAPYGGQPERLEEGVIIGVNTHVVDVKLSKWQSPATLDHDKIKLILRKIEDMSDDECMVVNEISPYFTKGTSEKYIRDRLYCIRDRMLYLHLIPEVFDWALKNEFDLFKLIENGLAIDSKTLK